MLKYNKERLSRVIKDFCIITKVSVAVLDSDFVTIVEYSDTVPKYCREIQKNHEGREKCFCSDTELLQKCQKSRQLEFHICHGGILDAVMPIISSDKIIGYILIGRMRVADFDEEKIKWLNIDCGKAREMYEELNLWSEKQIHSMFHLASMIVSFILTNDIMTSELDDFAADVTELIESNLNQKLSVDFLCERLNVSKNFLYYNFKNSLGMTVNEYINSRRLIKGRELLKGTDFSVSQIAEMTGIGSYTYFSKLFKKKYGVSPLKFRKINKEQ